ncbi:MFS transporter [Luteipulveratus halotolerans]|uniref:MFS transporter n=1 Tax=Luteipulveratus halotolerans TaxID=1631356 RepID=UPI0008FBC913|nr:MFS transporter [Luteipulveratus halotolerans]
MTTERLRTDTRSEDWSSFYKLWLGSTATLYVEQFISFAIPLLLVTQTGASVTTGQFVTFLYFVPYLIFGLNAGVWLEGKSHTRSVNIAAIGQTLLLVLLFIGLHLWSDSPSLFVGFVLISGIIAVFFQISFQSILPDLFAVRDNLYSANSKLALSDSITRVIGPASAGALIAWLSPSGSVAAVTMLSLLAALSFIVIRRPKHEKPSTPKTATEKTGTLIREGLDFVRTHRWLNPIILCGAYYIIFVTAIKTTVSLYLVDSGKASVSAVGIIISMIAAGYGLGSIIGRSSAKRSGARRTLQIGALFATIGAAAASFGAVAVGNTSAIPWVCGAAFLLHGLGDGIFAPTALSVRQIATPKNFMSRVTSVHRFFIWGGMSLGGLLAAIVTFATSPGVALVVMSFGIWGTLPILYRKNLAIHRTKGATPYERDPEVAFLDAQ